MSKKEYKSFKEFWPYYLSEHCLPSNRILHYTGSLAVIFLLIFFIQNQMWLWLPLVLLVGYGPAWIGHFIIEKNRPATLTYPLWSLMADYKMLYFALTGRLKHEWTKYF